MPSETPCDLWLKPRLFFCTFNVFQSRIHFYPAAPIAGLIKGHVLLLFSSWRVFLKCSHLHSTAPPPHTHTFYSFYALSQILFLLSGVLKPLSPPNSSGIDWHCNSCLVPTHVLACYPLSICKSCWSTQCSAIQPPAPKPKQGAVYVLNLRSMQA